MFEGKAVLVTGGTGSFGNQILKHLLKENPSEIRIFSRDEKKQYDMKQKYDDERIRFFIGDVRDFDRVLEATRGVDIIFHAAALKQVPNCEFNPMEAVKTNIIGADNVRRAAIINGAEVVVSISTDKAVKPVNVMGMTKAIQERVMINANGNGTKFIVVRYGNVIGSRGSVIPFFKERIQRGEYLPITDLRMTRFLLTLDEAIGLVFKATSEGKGGEVFVKKMPAARVVDIARVMAKAITGREDYPIKEVGIRPGEKIHEVLVSEEEMKRAIETENHYIIYPYGKIDTPKLLRNIEEYTSFNTDRLNEEQIETLLRKEGWIG
jgi:UDP-glucose 4-epimerase|uniref:NAD-dependent epimerase/dehydratase family protein n=1 Tax=Dictyoglomus turgidum TaxID=513050 RepID=A0A7C3SPR7_9BACT